MIRRITIGLVSVFVLLAVTACTQRIGDFTVLSTKNVTISEKFVKVGRFKADDMAWFVLFIPTGNPNFKTAVDALLDENGGELATNAVLSSRFWYAIITGQMGFIIEGDVWKRASVGDLQGDKELFEVQVNAGGNKVLVSTKNPSTSFTITTPESLQMQYEAQTQQ